ncbi:MAG: insulinase family protein, partial [Anaerolineaceae bacterium]|nr:insulinase family protein [Anaerolineaceae bacterium]
MKYSKGKNKPCSDNILRKELPNGIIVLAHGNTDSRTVVINGSMPCGAYLDPMDKTGLADFAANCLTHGTRSHDFSSLSELLEGSGASLGMNCGPRALTFSASCLTEDLPMLLGLLRECLDEPAFPQVHVEIHRQRLLSALELHQHDPDGMANERFDSLLFGDHPYGRREYGTAEEINSISREDLLDFQRRYFGPRHMILSVCGGLSNERLLGECENVFSDWKKTQDEIETADFFPPVPFPEKAVSEHIEIPEKSEMSLLIGTLGPARSDPDFVPAVLGNSILGEFGMMGRIGKAVRKEHGLAYYAGSSLTSLTYGGCWTVEAGVNPANVEKAAELIMNELRRFT